MIFTDGVHLISDQSLEELHMFVQRMGFNRCWYQGGKRRHPHYDLTTQRVVNQAISRGAKMVSAKELVKISLTADWRK